jgi:CRP-like cAMP-binding protein
MIYKEDDIDLGFYIIKSGEVEVIAIKSYFKDKQIHHIQKTKANLSSINSTNNP